MARALFERAAGGRHRGDSAGTAPAERVHPEVVEAMRELGIDLSAAVPRRLTDDLARAADVVVTMGCGDACPWFPGVRYEDWPLDDPAGLDLPAVRPIRDEIERRVRALLGTLGIEAVGRPGSSARGGRN